MARSLRTWWQSRSLRTRILVSTAAAMVLVLAAVIAAYAVLVNQSLWRSAESAVTDQAHEVARVIDEDDDDVVEALAEVPTRGSMLQVLDGVGVVAASNDVEARVPLTTLRPAVNQVLTEQSTAIPGEEGEPYAIAARGFYSRVDDANFTLVVATPLRRETDVFQGAIGILAAISVVLVGVLLLIMRRVLNTALGSMEKIRVAVSAVRSTDLSVRVPVPPGDDEVSRLALTMNDMLARLHRADDTQKAFISNASHELRSPITALRAILETARGQLTSERSRTALGETRRLEQLVFDLLTLAKADDRGLVAKRTPLHLEDFAWDEVYRLQALSPHEVTGEIDPAKILADKVHLQNILRNLADNAARHARSAVRIGVQVRDAEVRIVFDNDGEPVPAAMREAVFERFVRLDESRQRDAGGSGLGLAIVKALVEANAGSVRTLETPEGWCRFEVRMPATLASPQKAPA
ncbi:HAMP domain-containing protein [Micrococcales bacterium 31B]|nr:HAMP domain-containing protein [Micrococcales bacterium 31B]